MMRQFYIAPGRAWFALWLVLPSMLFGQSGLGPSLLTAVTGSGYARSNRACPCESVAESGDDAHHGHDERSRLATRSEDQCPLGCEDCTCCPGTVVAVVPSRAQHPDSLSGGALTTPPDAPAKGGLSRIFTPPSSEPSPVVQAMDRRSGERGAPSAKPRPATREMDA